MASAIAATLGAHRRPMPPSSITEADIASCSPMFLPAPELKQWARAVLIEETGILHNPDHAHLEHMALGFLWTNVENARQGRRIIGQAELGDPQGAMGKWAKARARAQVLGWFGVLPDFIITLDAHYAAGADDAEFLALVEHELYHCAQDRDAFGAPKFSADGLPVPKMRGHDVEEFIGVVRRYGAVDPGVRLMVDAVNSGPTVAGAKIAHVCGTCQRRAA